MVQKFTVIYLLGIGLMLLACKSSGNTENNGSNQNKKTFRLSGNVTYTSDYCGGVQPPNSLLEQLATPTPYAGKTFYLRAGEKNNLQKPILYTVITDTLGNYAIDLPIGNYCMIDEFRKDSSFMKAVYKEDPYNYLQVNDQECLQNWFNGCYYNVAIKNTDISNVNFNFHRPCFRPEEVPCISYIGPMPP